MERPTLFVTPRRSSRTRSLEDYTGSVSPAGVYRTDVGLIFRVAVSDEGGLRVEILRDGAWAPGPIGMVGLRLAPTTTKLSPAAIQKLPE